VLFASLHPLSLSVITQFDVPMIAFSDGLRSHHGA
jgi:hypothetical protein